MSEQTLGERIDLLIIESDLSRQAFADKAGMSIDRLRNLIKGNVGSLKGAETQALTELFNLNRRWLIFGEGKMRGVKQSTQSLLIKDSQITAISAMEGIAISDDLKLRVTGLLMALSTKDGELLKKMLSDTSDVDSAYVQVPRYDIRASAGAGSLIHDESIVDHLAFRREWLTQQMGCVPESVCVIQVRGDSMSPTINEADLLLLDMRTPDARTEGVYVIQLAGNLLVKRLRFKLSGAVDVISDNPRYGTETLTNDAIGQLSVVGRVVWHGCKF